MPLKILNNTKIICRYVKVNTFNIVVSILFYDKEKYKFGDWRIPRYLGIYTCM